jgi:hypothetical protein
MVGGIVFAEGKGQLDSSSNKATGSIGLSLEGRLVGRTHVFRLNATAGAKVGALGASGKSPSRLGVGAALRMDGRRPTIEGQLFFTGLAVYYLLFAEVSIDGTECGRNGEGLVRDADGSTNPETRIKGTEAIQKREVFVLLEPWSWP